MWVATLGAVLVAGCVDSPAGAASTSMGESTSTGEPTTVGETSAGEVTTVPTTGGSSSDGASATGEPAMNCFIGSLSVDDPVDAAADLAGHDCIDGNVRVLAGSGPDLAFMSEIRAIRGDFDLEAPHEIASLHGLEKLESVVGHLWLEETPNLIDAGALAGLKSVGGGLRFKDAPKLPALDLGALTQVGVDLDVTGASLASLDLGSLTAVPGAVRLADTRLVTLAGLKAITAMETLSLVRNDELVDLAGLAGLTSLTKGLTLAENLKIADLAGLASLAQVGGRVEISKNPGLVSVAGLEAATELKELVLAGNPQLADLTALAGLTAVDFLEISGSAALTSLAPLDGVTVEALAVHDNPALKQLAAVQGQAVYVSLRGNPALTSLAGLEAVTLANLEVADNDALIDLKGLGAVTAGVWLLIKDNGGLLALDGPTGLASAVLVLVMDNPKLTSLGPLKTLETVDELQLVRTKVADLTGLAGLTTVVQYLTIAENDSLVSLAGLEKLGSAYALVIRDNPKLTGVAALQDGMDVSYDFQVANNPALASCAARAVFEALAQEPDWYCYANKMDACSGPKSCKPAPMP